MKKIKIAFILFLLLSINKIQAQSVQTVRVLNLNSPSQTYLYTVSFDVANNATVNRAIVPSEPSDNFGVNIIGNGWSINNNLLQLPPTPLKNWYFVDVEFNGSSSIANTPSITISCPCGSLSGTGNCTASANGGTCVKCSTTSTCTICSNPKTEVTSGVFSVCPLIIQASTITFNN